MSKPCMYQAGDVVTVRIDLSKRGVYKMLSGPNEGEGCGVFNWMTKYAGQQIAIERILGSVYKLCGIDNCIWTDEMFEQTNECTCSSLL